MVLDISRARTIASSWGFSEQRTRFFELSSPLMTCHKISSWPVHRHEITDGLGDAVRNQSHLISISELGIGRTGECPPPWRLETAAQRYAAEGRHPARKLSPVMIPDRCSLSVLITLVQKFVFRTREPEVLDICPRKLFSPEMTTTDAGLLCQWLMCRHGVDVQTQRIVFVGRLSGHPAIWFYNVDFTSSLIISFSWVPPGTAQIDASACRTGRSTCFGQAVDVGAVLYAIVYHPESMGMTTHGLVRGIREFQFDLFRACL